MGRRGRARPSTRSARGARPRASTPGTGAAASCASRPRRRRTASAPTRSTAPTVLAQNAGRGAGALRLAGLPRRRVRARERDRPPGAARVRAARAAARARRADLRGQPRDRRSRRCRAGVAVAHRDGGRVRARTAVFAINAATGTLAPLRNRLTVSSSHIVCTEPVPDVLDALGWRGGESISDGRALLHYMRTTRDDRIVFGWAGGRMAAGARPRRADGGRPRASSRRSRADLVRFFPQLAGRRIAHAWGGPIDVSPTHRPGDRRRCAGCRPGPRSATPATASRRRTCSAARSRRSRCDRRDPVTRLPFVDPRAARRPARAVPDRGRRGHPAGARPQGGRRGGRPDAGPGLGRPRRAAGAAGLHIVR